MPETRISQAKLARGSSASQKEKEKRRRSKKGKRVTVKKQVKTRVSVNVKQSSGDGGGGVVPMPYWHPPPISNYVPTTTTLMSAVTSPLTPGNVGDTDLTNQIATLQRSIDSMAQAFPGSPPPPPAPPAPPLLDRGSPPPFPALPTPNIRHAQADAGAQTDPPTGHVHAGAQAGPSRRHMDTQTDAGAPQEGTRVHSNKRVRRRDAPDSNPRPHKRSRISDEEPTDMVGDIGPPPPPPKPPGPKPPGFASAQGRVRDAQKAHAHQKRVRNVLDTVAHHKDVLADLKATPYREPPRPRPQPPAAPVEPPKQWKTKPALKIKLKGFKAPELPPEVVKASKKGKRIVGKRNNNNFVMGIV